MSPLDKSSASADSSASTESIWVAEDNHDMRNLIAAACRLLGFHVEEIEDGERLLQRIERAKREGMGWPTFIIADHHMPGRYGLDVWEEQLSGRRDLAFVLISAFADRETKDRALALGALAVLDKPFELEDLLQVIRRHRIGTTPGRGGGADDATAAP